MHHKHSQDTGEIQSCSGEPQNVARGVVEVLLPLVDGLKTVEETAVVCPNELGVLTRKKGEPLTTGKVQSSTQADAMHHVHSKA
jgi:alkyl hydroperoxide reductase subunit AhpC